MADIDLLDRVIKHITEHPETWNQDRWHCGSAFCVAGHAAVMAHPESRPGSAEAGTQDYLIFPDGMPRYIPVVAREVLHLSTRQASVLFGASNTLESIKAMRDALAADPNADLDIAEDWG